MKRLHGIVLCLVLTSCTDGRSQHYVLDVTLRPGRDAVDLGSFVLGTADITLHIDALDAPHPRVTVITDEVNDVATPWRLTFRDLDGTILETSAPLPLGPESCQELVIHFFGAPVQTDILLHAEATSAAAATTLTAGLF